MFFLPSGEQPGGETGDFPMPLWIQEAIASVGLLIFIGSVFVLAAGDSGFLRQPLQVQVAAVEPR
jgi:hypothetical protein